MPDEDLGWGEAEGVALIIDRVAASLRERIWPSNYERREVLRDVYLYLWRKEYEAYSASELIEALLTLHEEGITGIQDMDSEEIAAELYDFIEGSPEDEWEDTVDKWITYAAENE